MALILATFGGIAALALLLFGLLLQATVRSTNLPLLGARQRHVECANHLQLIGEAFDAYVADNGHFPPAYVADAEGRPMHSWRVLLLPYLGHQELYQQYDLNLPWDDPQNAALTAQMPEVYGCPENRQAARGETCVMVIRGPGMLFQEDQCRSPTAILDPMQQTILLVEVAGTGVNWLAPRDLDVSTMFWGINAQSSGWGSLHGKGGAHVLMVDGSVRQLGDLTPPSELQAMATIAGGEICDPRNWETP